MHSSQMTKRRLAMRNRSLDCMSSCSHSSIYVLDPCHSIDDSQFVKKGVYPCARVVLEPCYLREVVDQVPVVLQELGVKPAGIKPHTSGIRHLEEEE